MAAKAKRKRPQKAKAEATKSKKVDSTADHVSEIPSASAETKKSDESSAGNDKSQVENKEDAPKLSAAEDEEDTSAAETESTETESTETESTETDTKDSEAEEEPEASPALDGLASSGPAVVDISNLKKTYGEAPNQTHALRGVDLRLGRGEFVAIIGTSGSGKTTLLNVLGGLDRRFKGDVTIAGSAIQSLDDKGLSRLRNESIGFVFQAFNLLPHLNCVDNVRMPNHFGGKTRSTPEQVERAESLLRDVGLEAKFGSLPTELSGGQKQRVAIARALYNSPKMILCDEPTGSLDQATGRQILKLFRQVNREQQITFVLVTHDENVSKCCDRVIRLEDGLVRLDARQEAISPDDLPASSFGIQ